MEEKEALIILNAVEGLSNRKKQSLIEYFGSASRVLKLEREDLEPLQFVSSKTVTNILNFPKDKFLENEYNHIKKQGVEVITCFDAGYPKVLKEITDAPLVLYVKGELKESYPFSIAIVGSRKSSYYGVSVAEKFAKHLTELNFTVISGMARGIDTAAHKATIKMKGKTIAVLGSGLSNIYPPENKHLFFEIAEYGAVISEFPMTERPLAYNFPRRNRIISGLSLGVIVVEAAKKSGALITADFALEQGREVFAVPGKVDSPTASGTHNLIKQGAKLATSIDDVLEDLQARLSEGLSEEKAKVEKKVAAPKKVIPNLSDQERCVYRHITDQPIHVDELMELCGSDVPTISILLQLELKNIVKQLPGKLFLCK